MAACDTWSTVHAVIEIVMNEFRICIRNLSELGGNVDNDDGKIRKCVYNAKSMHLNL